MAQATFEWLKLGCQCFLLSVDIYDTNILTWSGGIAPLVDPLQNQSFERLNFWCQCFLRSAVDILEMNILT